MTTALGNGGQLCVFANVGTHVIVDLAGWYRDQRRGRLHPAEPDSACSTRRTGPIGQSYTLAARRTW